MKPKDSSPNARDILADLLAILGAILITAGFVLAWPPLGLITGGIASITIGWRISQ